MATEVAGQPIYPGQDFYTPAFQVTLRGQELSRAVIHDVIDVTYRDSLDALDQVDFTINNWDAGRRQFKYSDNSPDSTMPDGTRVPSFDPGAQLELYMGYRSAPELTLMMTGEIVSLTPDFPASGAPTLKVRALSLLYRLQKKQTISPFENKTDSAIAREIARKLDVEIDTVASAEANEVRHSYVLISNEYPIIYLMQRAQVLGYDFYAQPDGKLFFGPSGQARPELKLEWGKSLIQFSPTLKTKGQVRTIKVRGWDPTKEGAEREIQGVASWDDLDTQALPAAEDLRAIDSALAQSETIVTDYVPRTQEEADRLARELLVDAAKKMVTGNGSTIGTPMLRAGRAIGIAGLGSRFSGRYILTSTNHTIGASGYRTSFGARMEIRRGGG